MNGIVIAYSTILYPLRGMNIILYVIDLQYYKPYGLLLTILPIAFCLLPTAFCLLPTAYCLERQLNPFSGQVNAYHPHHELLVEFDHL